MDRRRVPWLVAFVAALVAICAIAWTLGPSSTTAAAPDGGAAGGAEATVPSSDPTPFLASAVTTVPSSTDESWDDSWPDVRDASDELPPGADATRPVPLSQRQPSTTTGPDQPSASPTPTPTAVPTTSCIDPPNNTARCVTTTAPGPGATADNCDTGVGRTTHPSCVGGGTTMPQTTYSWVDPCTSSTTQGCLPNSTRTTPPPFPSTTSAEPPPCSVACTTAVTRSGP